MSEMIHFPWYGSRTQSDLPQCRFISSCQNPSMAAGFLSPLRYPVTEEHVAPTGEHDDPGLWFEITAVAWKSYRRVSQVRQALSLCRSEMCHPPCRPHVLRFTSRMMFCLTGRAVTRPRLSVSCSTAERLDVFSCSSQIPCLLVCFHSTKPESTHIPLAPAMSTWNFSGTSGFCWCHYSLFTLWTQIPSVHKAVGTITELLFNLISCLWDCL